MVRGLPLGLRFVHRVRLKPQITVLRKFPPRRQLSLPMDPDQLLRQALLEVPHPRVWAAL